MDNVENKGSKESEKFQKKTSGIVLTLFIGLIVVSFMFSGYDSMYGKATSDTVARVGSYPIKSREFSQEYQRQTEFFAQFMNGGNPLNNQQIQQFRIQESALNNLVSKKLALILGDKLGATPGADEVKAAIKEFPYFKTNGQFDVEKYKLLLRQNSLTPNDFEEEIRNSVKLQKVQALFEAPALSQNYLNDLDQFRSQKVSATFVKIEQKTIVKNLPVSDDEIKNYLATPDGAKRVEGLFQDKKASFSQPLRVKARHILLLADDQTDAKVKTQIEELSKKLTTKNFSDFAKKNSQDPQSKEKGGDLGWFEKGRMVPEFDDTVFTMKVGTLSKPIRTTYGYHIIYLEDKKEAQEAKFEDFKKIIAKESLQVLKAPEAKKVADELKASIQESMNKNDFAKAEQLAKNYGLKLSKNVALNRLEGNADLPLRVDQLNLVFSQDLSSGKALTFDDPESSLVLKVSPLNATEVKKDEKAADPSGKKTELIAYSRNLQKEILKGLEESVKVKQFVRFNEE